MADKPNAFIYVEDDEFAEHIAIGVHTGLRKGTDAEDAHDLWMTISNSETTAWSDAAAYFIWSLNYMGMAICKKEDEDDPS